MDDEKTRFVIEQVDCFGLEWNRLMHYSTFAQAELAAPLFRKYVRRPIRIVRETRQIVMCDPAKKNTSQSGGEKT